MDADKEGFLRSTSALVQTIGRAARHEHGRVIMYADHITDSMRAALDETDRRREKQDAYNKAHNITPKGVDKAIDEGLRAIIPQKEGDDKKGAKLNLKKIPKDEYPALIRELTAQMELASANLQFEHAAELRDTINDIKSTMKLA
jgi:excinuclease ABC subunit B